jgi:hypothetical protein
MKFSIAWMIALLAGLAVLAGYIIPDLRPLQDAILQVAVIVAAFAVLAGALNLLGVHWRKMETDQKGAGYSIIVVVAFFIPVVAALLDIWFSNNPNGAWTQWVYQNMVIPVEASLFALLAVILLYAAARMFGRRLTLTTIVFLGTVIALLALSSPYITGDIPALASLRSFISEVLATGGARGILLGVALGAVATAVRIFMGADRPYG